MSANGETKKHIDIVVKYFYPVAAGIETNIAETYSTLAKNGWDITVHTTRDTLTEKNILAGAETYRGLKIQRYRWSPLGYFPDIDWKNTDAVCLHNFNVVPHLFVLLRTLWMKTIRQKNFILILTPHGGFNPEWSIFPYWIALLKKFYHYTLGTLLINLATDGVRAVSEWERNAMIGRGIRPNLVRTISNGIEDDAFRDIDAEASDEIKNQTRQYGEYIIQIGRVYVIKNYETTLRALALLPAHIKYVIVGPVADKQYKQFLDDLIRSFGLSERVIFTGVVRGVDKFYLIKHAKMMVHMALWESFCNVVHEGMSQGLVCLVANNTALPLLIKDGINGYCLPTKDEKILAERMRRVLENPDSPEIKKIQENNLLCGRKHAWSMVAESMDQFYRELITLTQAKHSYKDMGPSAFAKETL